MTFWSQKVNAFSSSKIYTLIKTKWSQKWTISHTVLERRTTCLSSYKSRRKLKRKLWCVGDRERKKKGIFCTVYFVWRKFFNIGVLSHCIVYWMHFQNIHSFTYQETLIHALFCLFLKSSKIFSVSLNKKQPYKIAKLLTWTLKFIAFCSSIASTILSAFGRKIADIFKNSRYKESVTHYLVVANSHLYRYTTYKSFQITYAKTIWEVYTVNSLYHSSKST